MKKANLKTKTVIWLIITIVSLAIIILSSIWIANCRFVIKATDYVYLDEYKSSALAEMAYAISFLIFSVVTASMGTFISYAGIKSWKYNAVL
ncbi:MAG: hypothetical protein ACTTJO_00360 [Metamycoplasmataceae bacterium]|uniref:hypothetical protein n=1 Tax=Mycoplasmopsis lipophila TaxID=2117 RepID=UPI0038731E0D